MKNPLLIAATSFALLAGSLLHVSAAIIYSGIQDIPIPTNFNGVFIDIDLATTGSASFAGWDVNPFFGGTGFGNSAAFQPARTGTGNLDAIVRLDVGTNVDGSLNFSSGFGGSGDPNGHLGAGENQFAVGEEGYLGFSHVTNSAAGPHFGWMRVVFTNNTGGGLVRDWAFDDTGAPIVAAPIPEPSRAALLALAMACIVFRRRRHGLPR